jgi:tetratricopeptide (TPR) repeat protein
VKLPPRSTVRCEVPVSDRIRSLTSELAADPSSLVFLSLGEALRQGGRLEAAAKVAVQGLSRYPDLPEAHDLYARILVDQEDFEGAFDEWDMTLRLDSAHPGAHKGLGYLYYKADDLTSALRHLEAALGQRPGDEQLVLVIGRVRERIAEHESAAETVAPAPVSEPELVSPPAPEPEPVIPTPEPVVAETQPAESEAPANPLDDDGLLLVDAAGLRLVGSMESAGGPAVADAVAAELAGVSKEASRAVRLLQLGEWQSLALETAGAHFFLVPPTPETMLLAMRETGVPMARVALGAARALEAARRWLKEQSA